MTFQAAKRLAFGTTVLLTILGAARVGFARDEQLISDARRTIAEYRRTDPGLDGFFQRSAGSAVFPGIGKGGYIVGGAHGTGVLFEHGVPTGKVTVNQVSVGAQIGGESFSEVIFFETPAALADFRRGQAALAAGACAAALSKGAAQVVKYRDGVAIFTHMKGGLMADVSVGGQKFKYEPF
jgi:lipid-binding SYLF domain-containing protein